METAHHSIFRWFSKAVFALVPVAGVFFLGWESSVVLTWYWAAFVPAVLIDPLLSKSVWPDPPLAVKTPPPPTSKTPFLSLGNTKTRLDAAGMMVPGAPTAMRQGMRVITGACGFLIFFALWGIDSLDLKTLPVAVLVQTLRRATVERESRIEWMRRTPHPPDAMMLFAVFTVSFILGRNSDFLLAGVVTVGLAYEFLVARAENKPSSQQG